MEYCISTREQNAKYLITRCFFVYFSSAKTLVVSFIGMATQEVNIKANLNIVLKSDTEQLEEVMVVAYGTAKKSSFTGSAAVVKNDKIEKNANV